MKLRTTHVADAMSWRALHSIFRLMFEAVVMWAYENTSLYIFCVKKLVIIDSYYLQILEHIILIVTFSIVNIDLKSALQQLGYQEKKRYLETRDSLHAICFFHRKLVEKCPPTFPIHHPRTSVSGSTVGNALNEFK